MVFFLQNKWHMTEAYWCGSELDITEVGFFYALELTPNLSSIFKP